MDANEKLLEIRRTIDEIDRQLIPLFEKRMLASERVAEIKREHNLPVFDAAREELVIARAAESCREDFRGEAELLMRTIMTISKEMQRKLLNQPPHR